MLGHDAAPPGLREADVGEHLVQGPTHDDDVEDQVEGDDAHRDPDRFLEALQEDSSERHQKERGHENGVVRHPVRHIGILGDVRGGVSRRHRHRDDEVGKRESLALPPGQEFLQHQDAALAVRRVLRHLGVNGQGHEQGDPDQDHGGNGREHPGGEDRDSRLIPEGREIVDAGEAHDLPPRSRRMVIWSLVSSVEEPVAEPASVAHGRGSERLRF